MKRMLCALAALMLVLCALPAMAAETAAQPFTIRGDISFGLSQEEVATREYARGIDMFKNTWHDDRQYYGADAYGQQYELMYGFDAETGKLEEIVYVFSALSLMANLGEDAYEYAADSMMSLENALADHAAVCKTLEAKYGPAVDVERTIASFLSYGFTQAPNMVTQQVCHYLVEDDEEQVLIEALVLGMPATEFSDEEYVVYVTYERMTGAEYERKMNENKVEDFLNNLL